MFARLTGLFDNICDFLSGIRKPAPDSRLNPCPECKDNKYSHAELSHHTRPWYKDDPGTYTVWCHFCHTHTDWFNTEKEVINHWNNGNVKLWQ